MEKFNGIFLRVCLSAIPIIGIGWILAVTDYFGVALTFQQVIAVVLGLACACAFLTYPYFEKPGLLEIALSLIAFFSWFWMAYNFEDWIVTAHERTPEKWIPGALALVLMMEGLRKAAGKIIACLVWVLILYAFFGDYLPGALEAAVFPPTKTVTYFYADNNGVPGLVLQVVLNLVLAFIIFGKLMEVSGGTAFLTDLAMGWMGHRRGGPGPDAGELGLLGHFPRGLCRHPLAQRPFPGPRGGGDAEDHCRGGAPLQAHRRGRARASGGHPPGPHRGGQCSPESRPAAPRPAPSAALPPPPAAAPARRAVLPPAHPTCAFARAAARSPHPAPPAPPAAGPPPAAPPRLPPSAPAASG